MRFAGVHLEQLTSSKCRTPGQRAGRGGQGYDPALLEAWITVQALEAQDRGGWTRFPPTLSHYKLSGVGEEARALFEAWITLQALESPDRGGRTHTFTLHTIWCRLRTVLPGAN